MVVQLDSTFVQYMHVTGGGLGQGTCLVLLVVVMLL